MSLRTYFALLLLVVGNWATAQKNQPIPVGNKISFQGSGDGLTFYALDYRSPNVYLEDLKKMTGASIPSSLAIKPPKLLEFDDVLVIVGLNESSDSNSMIVLLAGDFTSPKVTYFIDANQDRNFLNDGGALKVRAWDSEREIVVEGKGVEGVLKISPPSLRRNNVDPRVRIENKVTLGINLGYGFGNLTYEYDNLGRFPADYSQRVIEKNIGVSLSYDAKRFNYGVRAKYQNLQYDESKLIIQRGVPFLEPEIDRFGRLTGNQLLNDNIYDIGDLDLHSNNRVQLGAFVTYKKRVSQTVDLQAFVHVGQTFYLNKEYEYYYDHDLNAVIPSKPRKYELGNLPFWEVGLRSEITLGVNKAGFLEIAKNVHGWNPDGFLDHIEHTNFDSKFAFFKVNVGYRVGLWNPF